MTRRAVAWAAAFVLLLGAPASAEPWRGWVVGVADGDTLTVERDEPATLDLPRQRPERVRLAGIDAPEREQPFGTSARRLVLELTEGSAVHVREEGRDRSAACSRRCSLRTGAASTGNWCAGGRRGGYAVTRRRTRNWPRWRPRRAPGAGDCGHTPTPSRRGSGGPRSGSGGPPRALPGRR